MSATKKYIEAFTKHLAGALKIGQALDLDRPGSDIRNIVIAGMGASGIGANLVESLTFGRIPIPITVCKSYNIPQFVSPHTLFIASSYSGDSEETIAALNKALLKRAQVIGIASGGKLLDICKEYNLHYIQLPVSTESPRAMLPYGMVALLYVLYHTNLIGAAFIKETENAIEFLDRGEKGIQSEAELIAKKLKGKLPIIYCDAPARYGPAFSAADKRKRQAAGAYKYLPRNEPQRACGLERTGSPYADAAGYLYVFRPRPRAGGEAYGNLP